MSMTKGVICGATVVAAMWGGVSALQMDQMEMDPEMQAWMEASMPGDHHEALNGMEGNWKAAAEFWMEPGGEATQSAGMMKNKWVLGGRFMKSEYTGDMMGMPFTGIGYFGYDNMSGQYISVWMDTMMTGMLIDTGTMEGNVMTMHGSMQGPDGQTVKSKHVTTIEDDNHTTFEMYHSEPGGDEMRLVGRIKYTRM